MITGNRNTLKLWSKYRQSYSCSCYESTCKNQER